MGRIIGIDLGTTNSLAAYYAEGGPRIIPLTSGEFHLPSAVCVDRTAGLLLGRQAREGADLRPASTILSAKRHMGTEHKYVLGGEEFRPQDVSAMILKELKRAAESHFLAPVDRAVISVPAYFNEIQRRATREAGEIAGFRVERLVSEPTAAALAFGVDRLDTEDFIVVYDLGGGTFDVSVLEMFEGIFNVRACHGDNRLGGDDFDARLLQWILEKAKPRLDRDSLTPHASSRLRRAAEKAKIDLSGNDRTTIEITHLPQVGGGSGSVSLEVTRGELEELTRDLLERTGASIRRALAEARVPKEKVGEVLLVGGATRMPMVREYLRDFFGKSPRTDLHPMRAVALGAAIQANMIGGQGELDHIVVTDVSPYTLGVSVLGFHGGDPRPGVFDPLIHRNASLPASCKREFSTVHPEQDTVAVEVYQGDDPLVENNIFLDRYYLGGIPTGSSQPEAVEITFQYDTDGVLKVDAVVKSTGKSAGIRIDTTKMKAVGQQIIAARSRVDRLWERTRPVRSLRELVSRLEKTRHEHPAESQRWLEKQLSEARSALESGDEGRIQEIERELGSWTQKGTDHEL